MKLNKHDKLILSLSLAIAHYEGYFNPADRPYINRNPGDLRDWPGVPIMDGFAVFPTRMAGWEALWNQIQDNINRGLTLLEFFAGKPGVYPGYSPAKDGNEPYLYARFVANQTGLPINQPLNQLA